MAPAQASPNGVQHSVIAVKGLVLGLAVISCMLRVYTRILTKAGLRSDDWLIMAAVVVSLPTAALLVWGKGFHTLQ